MTPQFDFIGILEQLIEGVIEAVVLWFVGAFVDLVVSPFTQC